MNLEVNDSFKLFHDLKMLPLGTWSCGTMGLTSSETFVKWVFTLKHNPNDPSKQSHQPQPTINVCSTCLNVTTAEIIFSENIFRDTAAQKPEIWFSKIFLLRDAVKKCEKVLSRCQTIRMGENVEWDLKPRFVDKSEFYWKFQQNSESPNQYWL